MKSLFGKRNSWIYVTSGTNAIDFAETSRFDIARNETEGKHFVFTTYCEFRTIQFSSKGVWKYYRVRCAAASYATVLGLET